MNKGFYERRKVRQGDFEYLLDDEPDSIPFPFCHLVVPRHLIPQYKGHPFWAALKISISLNRE